MKSLLEQHYFMPLAILMLGIIGRLWILIRIWRIELANMYQLLHRWTPYFPVSIDFLLYILDLMVFSG
jgi:hypothetical protein